MHAFICRILFQVELRFTNDQVVMRLDGQTQRVRMDAGESLPRNLGTFFFSVT